MSDIRSKQAFARRAANFSASHLQASKVPALQFAGFSRWLCVRSVKHRFVGLDGKQFPSKVIDWVLARTRARQSRGNNRLASMHGFLTKNRDDLIARCSAKVAKRPKRAATGSQLANGIPMFLEQLIGTLAAEEAGDPLEGTRISGPAGGDAAALSQIGLSATAHGQELMELGYTVDQVVHDYGDLCQSITDLAVLRDAPFSVEQFRTLNRCLDNAIADAVTKFSAHREISISRQQTDRENERVGVLVHELRNSLQTMTMALAVVESGAVSANGATGALIKRSLTAMALLLDRAFEEVRWQAGASDKAHAFPLAAFIADAKSIASLGASARGCVLVVPPVNAGITIVGNRDHLLAALVNLLQNAFKFTHSHTKVSLHAYADGDHVSIEVQDSCGGLPPGFSEKMFEPFMQACFERSGLGLGLAIARRTVEADGGALTVRDMPGTGCVFTMTLPRHSL